MAEEDGGYEDSLGSSLDFEMDTQYATSTATSTAARKARPTPPSAPHPSQVTAPCSGGTIDQIGIEPASSSQPFAQTFKYPSDKKIGTEKQYTSQLKKNRAASQAGCRGH